MPDVVRDYAERGLFQRVLIMKAINCLIAFLVVLAPISGNAQSERSATLDALYSRVPQSVIYDTISGIFFYENSIASYIQFDAIAKAGGFIKGDTVTEQQYEDGYYVEGWNYVELLKRKGVDIKFDKQSVASFYDSLQQRSLKDGTYMDKTNINPFCGAYYRKFKLTIEVVMIDTISQRSPLFLDCKQFDKYVSENNYRAYQVKQLPTYIITKFFTWEEL